MSATVVSHDAGEARRRVLRVQLLLGSMIEQRDKVLDIIAEARESEDHIALGYESFPKYVQVEYGDLLAGLDRGSRRAAVEVLADLGLSTRAIGSVVGTSHQTVANDLAVADVKNLTPDQDALVPDHEGDEHQVRGDDEQEERDRVVPVPVEPIKSAPVVGLDGKTYPREVRPRRRPLPDQYESAGYELPSGGGDAGRDLQDDEHRGHDVMSAAEAEKKTQQIRQKLDEITGGCIEIICFLLSNRVPARRILGALLDAQQSALATVDPEQFGFLLVGVFQPLMKALTSPTVDDAWRREWDHPTFLPVTEQEIDDTLGQLAALGGGRDA